MSTMFEDFEVFASLVEPLSRPNAPLVSVAQLAKRARLGDDKVRRVLSRFEEYLRCRVVTTRDRRMVLTGVGTKLGSISTQLRELSRGGLERDEPESLVIDAEPCVAESVLPPVVKELKSLWGNSVKARIVRLDPLTLQERLDNGTANIGVGFATTNAVTGEEPLQLVSHWSAAFRCDDPASERPSFPRHDLSRFAQVFASGWEQLPPAVLKFLEEVPTGGRIDCGSESLARTFASHGGVAILPRCVDVPLSTCRDLTFLPLDGIEPERLAVFLPRRTSALSEVAASFLTMLRNLAGNAIAHASDAEAAAATTNDSVDSI